MNQADAPNSMRLLDLTLPTAEANLALDEALLNVSEANDLGNENNYANLLRIWESPEPFVVIGRGSKRSVEADVAACQHDQVPILRRCSGGTAVVAGPGCLMYAALLSYEQLPELRSVERAHQYVMGNMSKALSRLSDRVQFRGSSDLAFRDPQNIANDLGTKKISGNSLRCKRRHLLYHGTVLYDFDLPKIERWLGTPPRTPDYRGDRNHFDFVTNFPFSAQEIRQAIISEWGANDTLTHWPQDETNRLLRDQYLLPSWNERV